MRVSLKGDCAMTNKVTNFNAGHDEIHPKRINPNLNLLSRGVNSARIVEKGSRTARSCSSVCYGVAVILLFIHPLFSNLIPGNLSYLMFVVGFVLSVYLFFRDGGIHFNLLAPGFHNFWMIVAIFVCGSFFLSHGRNLPSTLILSLSISLMLLAANSAQWLRVGVKCLVGMLLVFAVSTVAMYFFPALSDYLSHTLFANNDSFMGYQSGLTSHYSNNGLFNAIGAVVCFCYFQFGRSRSQRLLWGAACAFFFVALTLTGKRTGFVCAIAAMLIVYMSSGKSGKGLKTLIITILGGYLIIAFGHMIPGLDLVMERFGEAISSGNMEDSTSGRTLLWEHALQGWLQNPLVGNGWSSYYFIWPSGMTVSVIAHNELLNLLYETGIIGTVLIIACMIASLASTIKLVNKNSKDAAGLYLRVSLGIQIYTLLYGFTMGGIFNSPTYYCFYLLSIGIMLTFYSADKRRVTPISPYPQLGKRYGN